MADTTFSDVTGTPIVAAWLNDVNDTTYGLPSTSTDAVGDALIGVKRTETGAVAETQHKYNQYAPLSVDSFGAVADGTTNCTTAFTAARTATGGRYHLPGPGTYLVDASPDVWADAFTAGPNVNLKISGVTYNVSHAFLGPLRWVAYSNILGGIVHATTGNIIQQWQDGSSGTATYFYRGLAFSNDSHFIQAKPSTNGGSCDLLLQRSAANADANGNRFSFTFEESIDRWTFSHATSASGAPVFDSFMEVYAGTSASMAFPAIRPQFNQGLSVKQRAAGGFQVALEPTSSTVTKLQQIGGSATEFIRLADNSMGFFGAAGGARPTITGSRGGNVALANLLSNLAALGLITDSTTA